MTDKAASLVHNDRDVCPTCRHWTREGRLALAMRSRERPIYGTDFSKPLSEIIETIRLDLSKARGTLHDIEHAYPMMVNGPWGERVEPVGHALTLAISFLYGVMSEMRDAEARDARRHGRDDTELPS